MKIEINTEEVKRPIYIDVEEILGIKELKIKELNIPVLIYNDKANKYPRNTKLHEKDLNTTIENMSKFIAETLIKLIPEKNRATMKDKEAIFKLLRANLQSDIVRED